jgi:hypothetical protein
VTALPFLLATFSGAFLLFLVQPLLGRAILPWFGGGSAVWSACLLFFQAALVVGYGYAHVTRRLGLRRQAVLHVCLLALALVLLPITPAPEWKPPDGEALVGRVALLLAATVGVPYVLLASTAPLVQDWFARVLAPRSPYWLYVLSNVGSLSALLLYPLVVERLLPLSTQSVVWSWGFAGFVGACVWCCAVAWRRGSVAAGAPPGAPAAADLVPAALTPESVAPSPESVAPSPESVASSPESVASSPEAVASSAESSASPEAINAPRRSHEPQEGRVGGPGDAVFWVVLPALGSALLLATTSLLTQDVAAVPLLWVVPLALYLLSFVLAFARLYWRWFAGPVCVALAVVAYRLVGESSSATVYAQGGWLLGAFFVAAWVCHGELARLAPPPARLTAFYFAQSAGGSLGGLFVALGAPLLFDSYVERPLLFLLAIAALAALVVRDVGRRWRGDAGFVAGLAASVALVLAGYAVLRGRPDDETLVDRARNAYGVLRVTDEDPGSVRALRKLYHGRILHGTQFRAPSLSRTATSYYTRDSGLALTVARHHARAGGRGLVVAVAGLGAGTVAALAQPGDLVRFFDIDPNVVDFATRHFTYIRESAATVEIVTGDARLSLERERARPKGLDRYDVVALDAFSGDAIPVHLLTREAFALYDDLLREDGVLAVHITNRYLALGPVVRGLAAERGWRWVPVSVSADSSTQTYSNDWLLLTRSGAFLEALRPHATPEPEDAERMIWTDDFLNLASVLR